MGRCVFVMAACALFFAAGTSAKTQLLVTGSTSTAASGMTTIDVRGGAADAAWAQVRIYVPSGYTINLGHLAGTRIGTVVAQSRASGPVAGGRGIVLAADPKDAALQQAAAQCTGTPTHAGAWLLRITISPQTLDVPAFVDPTTVGESGFGSARLTFCLPPVPSFSDLKIALSAGVFTNPLVGGSFVWRALVTSWRLDGSARDPASTVETQGLVGVPSSVSLKGKVQTTRRAKRVKNSVLLSGTLLENLRGVGGAKVSFIANDRAAGGAATNAAGAYAATRALAQRTTFAATATVPTRELPCVNPLPPTLSPGGCISAMRAGYRLRSNSILVEPRRR
jgi:hypothetical protein